jgi:hypothetical protein
LGLYASKAGEFSNYTNDDTSILADLWFFGLFSGRKMA